MTFDWGFVGEVLPDLLLGLRYTLLATVVSYAFALVLGLVVAMVRRAAPRPVAAVVHWVMEFIRCTPLLVQLFFVFYVLPSVGVQLSPLTAGIIGLGVHYAAYTAEVYRSGLEGVPRGQWEAARALSLPARRTWTAVVLPQAVRRVIPALGNYLISMFKDTPLLFAITVPELLFEANRLGGQYFKYLEMMTVVGLLFICVSVPAAILIRFLERRYAAI
ncbi:ectoine/hydroxyectoine ABC transporter permease subunit EhuD [Marinactinospora thermotolerans]|uniref:Amino acid ABC transporter membrane protein 2, PAAT family n=1 Tax=Marinactinospora thermotolerans DSM 45154 TaxID=1122192 RepID=A0A1T4TAE1_9ACTN|nr:ectoine/hydroxyectoine ABC transporter permease subunit EhuD [Marinactinospora thermotolerans]SKA37485.1 amino acid ABC transporter membrane protein 2, PAAT family [Marinactinospora thermotolerans DSM 45154]